MKLKTKKWGIARMLELYGKKEPDINSTERYKLIYEKEFLQVMKNSIDTRPPTTKEQKRITASLKKYESLRIRKGSN